ncbi:MAG: hypothetical protein HKL88_06875 [Bacteroidia bacterium]|jgi:hypothetical protein|nr:hypothetical protein [Bacteroidia bacterium]
MKKLLFIFAFALISMLFMGCPYGSDVPIDKTPSVKIDANLIGVWSPTGFDSTSTYTVSKTDDYNYLIKKESTTGNETTVTKYKAFLSDAGGKTFINIWADDDSQTPKYYFYRLGWSADNKQLTMYEVTDNIKEAFTSSDDLKKFIKDNCSLSFFYNKDTVAYSRK